MVCRWSAVLASYAVFGVRSFPPVGRAGPPGPAIHCYRPTKHLTGIHPSLEVLGWEFDSGRLTITPPPQQKWTNYARGVGGEWSLSRKTATEKKEIASLWPGFFCMSPLSFGWENSSLSVCWHSPGFNFRDRRERIFEFGRTERGVWWS